MKFPIQSLLMIFCLSANEMPAQLPQGFMFPTGFSPRRGEAFIQNSSLVYTQATVGITNHLSVGGGIIPSILFDGDYFNHTFSAKYGGSLPGRNISAGLGFFHWGAFYFSDPKDYENWLFAPYGVVTFGTPRNNFTVTGGAFYGYLDLKKVYRPDNFGSDYDWGEYPKPLFGFSGHLRGEGNWAFVFDSYSFEDGYEKIVVVALGTRFYGRAFALDLSVPLVNFDRDLEETYPLPLLNLIFPIGYRDSRGWR